MPSQSLPPLLCSSVFLGLVPTLQAFFPSSLVKMPVCWVSYPQTFLQLTLALNSQPELWAAQHRQIPLGKLYVTGS